MHTNIQTILKNYPPFLDDKQSEIITCLDVKTGFVEGAHEQLEPDDGVNDDNKQY